MLQRLGFGHEVEELGAGAAALGKEIEALRNSLKGKPALLELLPDVQTLAETLPGVVASPWIAMVAPAATPKEIIARLNAEVVRINKTPELKQYLSAQGANPLWSAPDETRASPFRPSRSRSASSAARAPSSSPESRWACARTVRVVATS